MMETVEHAYHSCPAGLWRKVLEWWERRTGEKLPYTKKVTLMGVREPLGEHSQACTKTSFDILEEAFAMVHAATLETIKRERERAAAGAESKSTTAMWMLVRRSVEEMANARWRAIEQRQMMMEPAEVGKEEMAVKPHSKALFQLVWVHSGLLRSSGGSARPWLLRWKAARSASGHRGVRQSRRGGGQEAESSSPEIGGRGHEAARGGGRRQRGGRGEVCINRPRSAAAPGAQCCGALVVVADGRQRQQAAGEEQRRGGEA